MAGRWPRGITVGSPRAVTDRVGSAGAFCSGGASSRAGSALRHPCTTSAVQVGTRSHRTCFLITIGSLGRISRCEHDCTKPGAGCGSATMWADHREHAGSSPAGGVGEPVAVPPVRSHDAAKRPAAVVLALLLALALLAAGCEEVDQAAVPVGRPDDPISIASPSASTPAPTARIQSILPPEAPLSVPHASRVYFTSGGDLWQMPRE